jgi:chromate transporter
VTTINPEVSVPADTAAPSRGRLLEIIVYFLRLGFTAFGGPAVHIALMRDELVRKRKWVDEQHFLDLLGATNLIPGPNSTEMAIHLGYVRAGWPGLVAGGACFILPAMFIVLALAWAYVTYGALPAANAMLYAVKPVVIVIVLQALWGLGQQAIKSPLTAIVGLAVAALYFFNVDEVLLLFGGSLLVMIGENLSRMQRARTPALVLPLGGLALRALDAIPFDMTVLFLTFLKIGSVLYGSGYVLLAFMRSEFVTRLGWLTDTQLIDAIAIGQVTPGPVFTTATFVGYILGGLPGGLLATLGIFLPSFVFVAVSNPFIPRLRKSTWAGALLDGANVTSLGLMAAVTLQLGVASLVDPLTVMLAIVCAVLLFRYKVNTTWLVVGSAIVGIISALVRG